MLFYTLNEHIGAVELKAIDMGGSMYKFNKIFNNIYKYIISYSILNFKNYIRILNY